jgi:hypothetical protein
VNICSKELTEESVANYEMLIKDEFKYRMYVDGLPSATVISKDREKHT